MRIVARRALPLLLAAALAVNLVPTAHANPVVPYCAGSVNPVSAVSMIDPATCETATGRVFPEAFLRQEYIDQGSTGVASDYVSFPEFQAGLQYLADAYPNIVTIHEVAKSAGTVNPVTGAEAQSPIYIVELTNKDSPIPIEQRQSLLFMLSIHGNEKGGREGGFRVLEDLVKGIGFASEGVQNGAGLPEPIAKPSGGGNVATYEDYLDFQRVFLLFPNVDGWIHDEAEYVAGTQDGSPCTVAFCRTNGDGVDLNRQAPTMGWQNPNRNTVGEPEAIGYYNWLLTNEISWNYAIDIHGMLNHQNFVAIMLPAGSLTPQEMQRSLRLAETLKERLNGNPHFAEWTQAFATAESAEDASHPVLEGAGLCGDDGAAVPMPLVGGVGACDASKNAGSTVFAEYYTVIDAIGYTDSGFNGDYFAQNTGLNAPGYDIEMAYNHITVDSQWEAAGNFLDDYHVKTVREIVKSFMDAAALDVRISFETQGTRTLYVEPSYVATNADDKDPSPGGWAGENPGDDIWEYSAAKPFAARPAKYWEDLQPFLRNGKEPGVLVKATASEVTPDRLAGFTNLVIPGSAIRDLEGNPGSIATIKAWTEAGGNLVLTDEALRFLDLSGITQGSVDSVSRYMGGIKMDLANPMLEKVRGGVKQTYEPTPLGFEVGANAAPNWFVAPAAVTGAKGTIAGIECGTPNLGDPCTGNGAALGTIPLGKGKIQFIGALLPDPTEEFYHPYGLDHYATTYSGNQILRNMLGWDEVFSAPPVVIDAAGTIVQSTNEPAPVAAADTATDGANDDAAPGAGLALLAVALVAAAIARRR